MAIVKTGGIISEIKGKVGGHCFQNTQGGLTMRIERSHVNPKNPNQLIQRNALSQQKYNWNNLSLNQRLAWDTYAVYRSYPQRKDSSRTMSGMNVFVKENITRQQASIPGSLDPHTQINDPVMDVTPPPVTSISISNVSGALKVVSSTGWNILYYFMSLNISRPLSPSQRTQNNKYRLMRGFSLIAGTYDITSQYIDKFGIIPASGSWINVRVCQFSRTTNAMGNYTTSRIQVG